MINVCAHRYRTETGIQIEKREQKMEKVWWENPMRVIQYNLQVKDTPEMVPDRIARSNQKRGDKNRL